MDCPICQEHIASHEKHVTECNHTFHRACISQWHAGTCPMCRAEISMGTGTTPFLVEAVCFVVGGLFAVSSYRSARPSGNNGLAENMYEFIDALRGVRQFMNEINE